MIAANNDEVNEMFDKNIRQIISLAAYQQRFFGDKIFYFFSR